MGASTAHFPIARGPGRGVSAESERALSSIQPIQSTQALLGAYAAHVAANLGKGKHGTVGEGYSRQEEIGAQATRRARTMQSARSDPARLLVRGAIPELSRLLGTLS